METPKWIDELISKGGSVESCIDLWKDIRSADREERAAEREMKKIELERHVKLRELEVREKELDQQRALGQLPSGQSSGKGNVKLPKFTEGQDPDVFLRSFERLATLHKWQKSEWPIRIVPLLSGKALEAYSRLSDMDSGNYDKIKDAILKRYELTAEAYRSKFRGAVQEKEESFKEFKVRVEGFFKHWCVREDIGEDYDELYDMVLREQLLNGCSKELKLWVNEHRPKTAQEVVELAESYQTAHRLASEAAMDKSKRFQGNFGRFDKQGQQNTRGQVNGRTGQQGRSEVRTCFVCQRTGHLSFDCPLNRDRGGGQNSQNRGNKNFSGQGQNQRGKFALCVKNAPGCTGEDSIINDDSLTVKLPGVSTEVKFEKKTSGLDIVKGMVMGKVVSVLRDTGSSTVFIHSSLVNETKKTGKSKGITLADGTARQCDEVWIDIDTPYIKGTVSALVLDTPFADLVIGNYVSTAIPKEVHVESKDQHRNDDVTDLENEAELCHAMQTRSQSRKSEEKKESQIDTHAASKVPVETKFCSAKELQQAQISDTSLDGVRKLVGVDQGDRNSYFIHRAGILYRIYVMQNHEQVCQIVLPKIFRKQVLGIAHDIPLAGHLGTKKTRERILQHFYWPGLYNDVSDYCRSCDVCQLGVPKGRITKVPLVSIPPLDVPFKRVAIDFIGPLPVTDEKNRYILTLVDYATRYPEAVALKNQEAETVAEALMGIFSRVGIPEEMLSDQGSNFMSSLMTEVCRLLKVKKMVSSVYHPQANGLCEKMNGVLKRMLRSYAIKEPYRWDKHLPYILFAYREVPNETTGFSPFELLYGRHVRGPLSILKEQWEEPEECQTSVLSYLLETREKLKMFSELAHKNEVIAKGKQKVYYDKKAKHRDIKVGSKVLVLLPTSASKLMAQWKGPYTVIEKVSPVDYKVKLKGKDKVYHINMLKTWYERNEEDDDNFIACIDVDESVETEELEVGLSLSPSICRKETVQDVDISEELTVTQRIQLEELLQEFDDVFTDVPKRTDVIQHKVKTTTDKPVYKKPYPLPYALRDRVQKEIDDMLAMGIIIPCASPYAAPVVIVGKKNTSAIRFCVDYRDLNKITEFDPRPMPRIDEMVNKVSKARYVSKIDLTKGYWQISLDSDAVLKSSFVTPMGQYAFTVMPFGMVNGPASFVRLMDKVLQGCKEYADAFIDDIGIYSDVWEDHLNHLRSVLLALRKANLAARPSKCSFGFKSLEFLGHIVGNGKIKPTPDKIEAIQQFPVPSTKKQIRSFVGCVGFYRKFISNFSEYTAPLTDLTRKGLPNKVKWLDKHQKCFEALKAEISKEPVLRSPDFSKMFYLRTDASKTGVGAVLEQISDGDRHPVMFLSKKFNKSEDKYAVIEKECFAIVWAVKMLRVYLEGKHFVIETDHAPLQWLNKMKLNNQRLLRWSLVLQEFRFDINHIAGKVNQVADALSRIE